MDSRNQKNDFHFTYSSGEQEELRAIRQKYLPPEEDKLQAVRRLDARVTNKAAIISILIGITGTLLLGIGMSCCLAWRGSWFFPGILVGLTGIATLGTAYPVYRRVLKKEREKIAPEILRLTEELMK